MAKFSQTITADGDTLLARINTPRSNDGYGASIYIYGTFGSGTVTIQLSPDNGVTKFTAKDINGNDIIASADSYFNFVHGIANVNGEQPQIFINVAGSTSPDITVDLFDVR